MKRIISGLAVASISLLLAACNGSAESASTTTTSATPKWDGTTLPDAQTLRASISDVVAKQRLVVHTTQTMWNRPDYTGTVTNTSENWAAGGIGGRWKATDNGTPGYEHEFDVGTYIYNGTSAACAVNYKKQSFAESNTYENNLQTLDADATSGLGGWKTSKVVGYEKLDGVNTLHVSKVDTDESGSYYTDTWVNAETGLPMLTKERAPSGSQKMVFDYQPINDATVKALLPAIPEGFTKTEMPKFPWG